MKKISFLILLGLLLNGCGATTSVVNTETKPILATIDLVHVTDDKVNVSVDPGEFTSDEVTFYIPVTVPGTYSIDNYGQYIEGFKALDYEGKELPVARYDQNTWNISNGKNLDKVVYRVNDTYDTENEKKDHVFSPAGTNILRGKNFMLNLHGFIGYFKGMTEVPYQLYISSPDNLIPTTSMSRKMDVKKVPGVDVFNAARYFEVTDNPIMYASPDTTSFQLKDIKVTLGVYSPNKLYDALDFKPSMEKMMQAQKAFLGTTNGTKSYDIILYLSNFAKDDATGFGALEHHKSTVVVFPEQMDKDRLEQAMIDVVSHEFFHTLTPLNVHSREIQYFDYNHPKMSEHLWMYEGTTEYFANLFQIKEGLIDETEFYKRMMEKINNSKQYDDTMSFTKMSKNVLEEPYKDQYPNVYEKGALINMALDITLRDLSQGEKGVLWMMKELAKKYDDKTPFDDDQLIPEIVSMTYPEVQSFFDSYVTGTTPIDYAKFLAKVGLAISEQDKPTGYFMDGEIPFIDIDPGNDNAIFVRKGIVLNNFFTDLGAKGGDIIKSIDGKAINLVNIRLLIGESFNWSPEREISMVVDRNGEEVSLKGKVGTPVLREWTIAPMKSVSDNQVMLREAWLKE
ncbi:peptidase M61 [Flavobacteriaceae bacterium F89]|uniref:Peptidase M61 n=1 Tax=Cerina litoralis TaxID=2874477 RepID=A0AAE3EWF2_9FLAO|nr:peptidase M61 [Cerina litoralis]MCG2461523.1 peptidase M61 [Cerina litoralis]